MNDFFEDLQPGREFHTDAVTVTEEDIIRFALEWDPQPYHVDKGAAEASVFGRLIGSGLMTMLLTFRLCVEAEIFTGNAVAGFGFEEVRFPNPVYPGNRLRAVATVREGRLAQSRPGFGIVGWDIEARDEGHRVVCTMGLTNLVRCRNREAG